MSRSTLRRSGAFLASAGLLASLTLATVAAPAAAGKCEPYTGQSIINEGCYYYDGTPINGVLVAGGKLNGSPGHDFVYAVGWNGNEATGTGTFNGGGGDDEVYYAFSGTFNGGSGDDTAYFVAADAVFNGGPGSDAVEGFGLSGTFNGGSGDDEVSSFAAGSTFAGGGGADCYYSGDPASANIYSAEHC